MVSVYPFKYSHYKTINSFHIAMVIQMGIWEYGE